MNIIRDDIPPIVAERRIQLKRQTPERTYAALMKDVPELDVIELRNHSGSTRRETDSLCVVCWNGQRGGFVLEDPCLLERHPRLNGAEVFILNEMDVGMARTSNHHTVRQLAERMGLSYVFATEFLELTKGELEARGENERGLHGNAILSRCEIRNPRLLRLSGGEQWLEDEQQRVGSRIALACSIEVFGKEVTLVSTHLESEAPPELRSRQMEQILAWLDRQQVGRTVLAGDLNTWSIDKRKDEERARLASSADPAARLLRPMPYEALFDDLRRRSYEFEETNDLSKGTYPVPGFPLEARLDWIVARGLAVSGAPQVVEAGHSETLGRQRSDHHALATCFAS